MASGQKLALEHGHVENNRCLGVGEEWGVSRGRHSMPSLHERGRAQDRRPQNCPGAARLLTTAETLSWLAWFRATSSGTAESACTCIHAPPG